MVASTIFISNVFGVRWSALTFLHLKMPLFGERVIALLFNGIFRNEKKDHVNAD